MEHGKKMKERYRRTRDQEQRSCASTVFTMIVVLASAGFVQAEQFTFAVFGDNRPGQYQYSETPERQSPRFHGLVAHMVDKNPDFVVGVGDFISGYVGSSKPVKSGARSMSDQVELEIDRYVAALQPLKAAKISVYNVPGNHDIFDWKFAENLYTKRLGPLYQSFDYVGSHFIILNTEEVALVEEGGTSRISPNQFAWLEEDLRNAENSRHRFVFLHRPIFSSREVPHVPLAEQDRQRLHDLFIKHKVRMVFAGHEHTYNYQHHDGVDYYITGLAGVGYDDEGNCHYLLVNVSEKDVAVKLHKTRREAFPLRIYTASDTESIDYDGVWSHEELPDLQRVVGISGSMISKESGATARLEFYGTSVSAVFGVGYENGIVNVSVDGRAPTAISLFGTSERVHNGYLDVPSLNYREVPLATDLKPGKHSLVLSLTDQHDKERYPTPAHLGPTPPPEVCLIAVRVGDFPFATFAGEIRDAYGVRLGRIAVSLKGNAGEYSITSGDDGSFSLSGIRAGEHAIRIQDANFDTVTDTVDLAENQVTGAQYRLSPGTEHPLYGNIFYPSGGVPALVEAGKQIVIEYVARKEASDWRASLALPGCSLVAMHVEPRYVGENRWDLTATIPIDIKEELYDLSVTSTAGEHTQHRAVKVVQQFKTEFFFAVTDSIEEDYEMLQRVIADLNELKPEFVIFTGDNVANPKNPLTATRKFRRLMSELETLRVPSFLVAGNHDLGAIGEAQILPIWQECVGKLYHSFNYGSYHFVGINNGNCQLVRMEFADPEQIEWIKNDLALHQEDKLRFTFRHIVLAGFVPIWWPEWEWAEYRVNMILYGHYAQNSIMQKGDATYVQTADLSKHGWYRLVGIRDDSIQLHPPSQAAAGP